MSLAKAFERQLDRVVARRLGWIWRDVGLAGPGRHPNDRGHRLRGDVAELMRLVARLSLRHVGHRTLRDSVLRRRRWSLRRRNLRGWRAKRDSFTTWYHARVAARTCVYVAWAGRRCLYVGRSEIGHHRPRSHFEKGWFGRVTHIDVFVPSERRRSIVKLECLLTHLHEPTQARQRPARRRHRSKCPVCATCRRVRNGLRRALGV